MTNKKDWVLDPFLGSGTSIISALRHGRKGVGAETNKTYIKITRERIKQLQKGSLKIRHMNTPIYNPTNPTKTFKNLHRNNNDSLNQKNLFDNNELDFY